MTVVSKSRHHWLVFCLPTGKVSPQINGVFSLLHGQCCALFGAYNPMSMLVLKNKKMVSNVNTG